MNTKWYQWYIEVIKKYTVFSGRASRSEFWFFYLMANIVFIALFIVDAVLHTFALILMYIIFLQLPVSGLLVRRMHDIGKSGWWTLIYWFSYFCLLIFIINADTKLGTNILYLIVVIINLAFGFPDSQPGTNRFGENPKGVNSVKVENANNNTKNLNQDYKFCTKCGYKNDILANYCKQCGEKF